MQDDKQPFSIERFLDRFKRIVPQDRKVKEVCIVCVEDVCNIVLHDYEIRVMKNNIYFRTSPIKKTEILRKKDIIIRTLEEKTELVRIALH